MDWISKMREGMKLMQAACNKNDDWTKCKDCPFDFYCTMLMDRSVKDGHDYDTYTPAQWEED